jgi:predicted MFS family arabinose efflux permease
MRRGPPAQNYPSAVGLVVSSLVPYLVLSAAVLPLRETISKSIGMSSSMFDLTVALSTGAYSAGTVLAVQLALHLPARRLLVVYESAFVVSSILAAWAPTAGVFAGAFIAQGLCTNLMLIAAVPPLVTSWPAQKMPFTGAIMNLCIFGAVAAGPTLGALQLAAGSWRPQRRARVGVASPGCSPAPPPPSPARGGASIRAARGGAGAATREQALTVRGRRGEHQSL